MAKKPFDQTGHRQRPLEPPDNAQFRDMRDQWMFRSRAWKLVRVSTAWIGGVGLGMWLLGKEIINFFVSRGGAGP